MAFASDPSPAPVLANSFNESTWLGNSGNQPITGYGFKPNFVWIKNRQQGDPHMIFDSLRGVQNYISSNLTSAEASSATSLLSFDSDGFTLGGDGRTNTGTINYMGWAWKANSIPTINTDGTIQSVVSANANAGFSIIKYIGNETAGQTVGHGLSAAPEIAFIKQLDGTREWQVPLFTETSGDYLILNSTAAEATDTTRWSAVSSTTFTIGAQPHTNGAGSPYIAYCFHSVSGYSKFGSYVGTGLDQSITGLGFQPNFVMIKCTTAVGNWSITDSVRGNTKRLRPNSAAAEDSPSSVRLLSFDSDGFTLKGSTGTDGPGNKLGETFIYVAFKIN
jgi:hypothetical protein